ncbi:DUF6153 family protein [Streptomyces sp. NPDC051315]|uniref:DUF6153 family protein n=1 Tax=Streptomyces sp. NPDC051315 TaxID=3365650 RepID=UPI003794371D
MTPVNRPEQRTAEPPARRWRALLVLGLLAGLLGMHGLAPGGALADHSHARPMTVTATVVAHDDCSGHGDCGGSPLHHADPTCASAGVSGGPALPALVPDPVAALVRADAVRPYAAVAPDGARAPPSLAELQLLRI